MQALLAALQGKKTYLCLIALAVIGILHDQPWVNGDWLNAVGHLVADAGGAALRASVGDLSKKLGN